MTFDDAPVPEDDLDGHTMEELGAYLDRGRTPRDPAIEASPACRLALSGMQRLRELSWDAMQHRADAEPDRDSVWISGLLETIRSEVRAGRDVPVAHPDPLLRLTITEEGRTYTVQTEGGFLIKANPAVAMLADADRRFKSYLVEFGLTPAARTKVKVDGGEKEEDPLNQFFG